MKTTKNIVRIIALAMCVLMLSVCAVGCADAEARLTANDALNSAQAAQDAANAASQAAQNAQNAANAAQNAAQSAQDATDEKLDTDELIAAIQDLVEDGTLVGKTELQNLIKAYFATEEGKALLGELIADALK